jgi:cysteine desulfurase / selenocysteine lyase
MTEAYESARSKIKDYLNARSEKEIILTNGATAAINLAAFSFGEAYIQPGDEIIVTAMEHHSNLVPWQIICQRKGAILKIVPFSEQGELLLDEYEQLFSPRTKIVAIVHVSNSLGTINPVKRMIETAHQAEVPVLIDGAQAISHTKVDVQDLDCDFYAFSGHKMYGPTGTGILYGKERWLQEMPPYQSGGDMIEKVTLKEASYNELPFKFEAGTPNYIGLAGLGLAADYLTRLGLDRIQSYENQLLEHATKQLSSIKGLKFYGQAQEKICNISFSLDGASPYDVGLLLDKMGIAVRTGHHCTQPIWDYYGVEGSVRASLAFYNTIEEIDAFVAALHKIKEMF